ncbi:MAG: VOC family protein, partial [Chloroflexi bacterium]
MRFDHAIFAINNLDKAVQNFRQAGFTVIAGGEHASGTTHNALVCLADGTYLELLAPTGKSPKDMDASDFSGLLREQEGFMGFALRTHDLDGVAKRLQQQGVNASNPKPGSRIREDGVQIEWRTVIVGDSLSPFMIQDVTDKKLRVPEDQAVITHENGARGIHSITMMCQNIDECVLFFRILLNQEPVKRLDSTMFVLEDDIEVHLVTPDAYQGDKALMAHINAYGDVPFTMTLRLRNGYM